MGRSGHLQTRHAEHRGPSLTAYCSQHAADFLEERGLEVVSHPGECEAGDADQWEIEIPVKRRKNDTYFRDFGSILKIAAELRKNPVLVKDDYGDDRDCGDDLADILEEGVRVAKLHKYNWIIIDWWD